MQKKVVLVTGANGDIGKAIYSKLYQSNRYLCIPHFKNKTVWEKQKKNPIFKISNPFIADLSDLNQIARQLKRKRINVDILINNAGHYKAQDFFKLKFKDIIKEININFLSSLQLIHYFGSKMRSNGSGKIINISSGSGKHGGLIPSYPYALSKNAINFTTKILPKEFEPYNIKIFTLIARFVETKMFLQFKRYYFNFLHKPFQTPIKIYKPEEVAERVFKLIEDNSIKNGHLEELL